MNDYIGRNKMEKKKESIIGAIKNHNRKDENHLREDKKKQNSIER